VALCFLNRAGTAGRQPQTIPTFISTQLEESGFWGLWTDGGKVAHLIIATSAAVQRVSGLWSRREETIRRTRLVIVALSSIVRYGR